jgi:hypothetical protein
VAALPTPEQIRACALVWDGVATQVQGTAHQANAAVPGHHDWQGVYAENFRTWWGAAHPGLTTVARVAESLREGLNRFANIVTGVEQELEAGYSAIRGACVDGSYARTADGCTGMVAIPAAPSTPSGATPTPGPTQGAAPSGSPSTPSISISPIPGPGVPGPAPQPNGGSPPPASYSIMVQGWQVQVEPGVSPSNVAALGTAYAHFATAKSRYQSGGSMIAFDLVMALGSIQQDTAFPPLQRGDFPEIGDPTGMNDPTWRLLTANPAGPVLFRPGPGKQFDFDNDNIAGAPPDWYQPVHQEVPWEQKLAHKIDEITHALSGPLTILSLATLAIPGVGEEELGALGLRALRGITLLDNGGKVVGDLTTNKPAGATLKDIGGFGLESTEAVKGLSALIVGRLAPHLSGPALSDAIGSVSTLVYEHSVPEPEGAEGSEGRQISQEGIDAVTTEARSRLALIAATENP